MCSMSIRGLEGTRVPDVEVQANVGAVIQFKVVVFPRNNDWAFWTVGLSGQAGGGPVTFEPTADAQY